MESAPVAGQQLDGWIESFRRHAEANIRAELAGDPNLGTLRDFRLDAREDGLWAAASFTVDIRPGTVFSWTEHIVPVLSTRWPPDFAATLYATHLIEWFHTRAKRRVPASGGTVTNDETP